MPCSQVAYSNLRAEMARLNITIQDIARECGYNRNTLSRRLSKKIPPIVGGRFEDPTGNVLGIRCSMAVPRGITNPQHATAEGLRQIFTSNQDVKSVAPFHKALVRFLC